MGGDHRGKERLLDCKISNDVSAFLEARNMASGCRDSKKTNAWTAIPERRNMV